MNASDSTMLHCSGAAGSRDDISIKAELSSVMTGLSAWVLSGPRSALPGPLWPTNSGRGCIGVIIRNPDAIEVGGQAYIDYLAIGWHLGKRV